MCWILNYYKNGIPDWLWYYQHYYAPFLTDFSEYLINDYQPIEFQSNEPISPFLQLLMVLPQGSANLIPEPLDKLLNSESSLGKYFPNSFEIDLTGKRKEWEGVVILPMIKIEDFQNEYNKYEKSISFIDKKRNIIGKNFIYKYDPNKSDVFSSFYGNIYECPINISIIFF
jgi:5'-3' exoribonuclease 1